MRSPWKIPCATPAWGAWSLWTMSHPSQFDLFRPDLFRPVKVLTCLGLTCLGQHRLGPTCRRWVGPRTVRPRRVKASQGGVQTWIKWGLTFWGPKFHAFFFSPPATFFFLSFSGVFLVPEMCTFGVLGLSWETGLSHDSQKAHTYTFLGPDLQKHQNSTRRHPERSNVHIRGSRRFKHHQNSTKTLREREKKNKNEGGRGKKSEKFRGPHPSGPPPFNPPPFMP